MKDTMRRDNPSFNPFSAIVEESQRPVAVLMLTFLTGSLRESTGQITLLLRREERPYFDDVRGIPWPRFQHHT